MSIHIILGPPGTGKTTYLLKLIEENLSKGIKPSEIAFVSFTREGANQGIERACKKFRLKKEAFPYFRTLHSLAFQQLGLTKNKTMDTEHFKSFSKAMGMHFVNHYNEEFKHGDDRFLFLHDLGRNNPAILSEHLKNIDIQTYLMVQANYNKYKELYHVFDYTDMIESYALNGDPLPVKIFFLDEAQDLTPLQWKMFFASSARAEKIYIAGDDDQAIFSWAGADVEKFLAVQGEVTILDKSYRLPDEILNYANSIAHRIKNRMVKDYHSRGEKGKVEKLTYLARMPDSLGDGKKSWLLLSRNTCFLQHFEAHLQKRGVYYTIKGHPSIKAEDIQKIKNYETLQQGREIKGTEKAVLTKLCISRLRELSSPWYTEFRWPAEKINYLKAFLKKGGNFKSKVEVNTIHRVKGSEADNVILLPDITLPVKKNLDKFPDSEHRVFYVAVTRAREKLFLVSAVSKRAYPL